MTTLSQASALPRLVKPTWTVVDEASADAAPVLEPGDAGTARVGIQTHSRLVPAMTDSQTPFAETLNPLQSWEGVVLDVHPQTFVARLVDPAGAHPDEEVELANEELSPFDLGMVERGAIFYWTIGYREVLPRGARSRFSEIRFRRLPAWSDNDLRAARRGAESLAEDLGW
jgi:hypothetical protein